jgi:hypothetical protein
MSKATKSTEALKNTTCNAPRPLTAAELQQVSGGRGSGPSNSTGSPNIR